jgi:DNA-binding transcriptional MerR regulator
MSDNQGNIQIGMVAKQLGVSTRTIRYYEEIGLMGQDHRQSGSTRFYSHKDILRLRFILKLKEIGITLKEMREISINYELNNQSTDKMLSKLITILDNNLESIESKIKNLQVVSLDIENYKSRVIDLMQKGDLI